MALDEDAAEGVHADDGRRERPRAVTKHVLASIDASLGRLSRLRRPVRARIALAWLLHKPGVTAPIVGATKIEHLEDALAAEQLVLSDEEIAQLEEPCVPHEISGH